jgi:FkbM family methyltransferase
MTERMDMDTICEKMQKIKETYSHTDSIVMIGAGFDGNMALEELEELGENIAYVCDNDPAKKTQQYYRSEKKQKWIPCKLVEEIDPSKQNVLYLIATRVYYRELANQLEHMGITDYMSSNLYLRSKEWENGKLLYDSLRREASKKTLCTLLTIDFTGDRELYYEIYQREQYFGIPEFLKMDSQEVLCEVGAYMGETLEKYIWERSAQFKQIYAFEPSDREYKATMQRLKRLKAEWAISDDRIHVVKAAVGEMCGTQYMSETEGAVSKVEQNGEKEVQMVNLDTFFEKESVSFLIADIEGYEMHLLNGMEQVIQRDKPKVAIAVYHRPLDLWKIQQKLASLRSDYRFDLVHHGVGGSETVLYAY